MDSATRPGTQRMLLCSLILCLIVATHVACDDSSWPFQRHAMHKAAVLGDYLYIEGGEISNYVNERKSNDAGETRPSNKTLSIPLKNSWTNSTVQIREIDKPNGLPQPMNRHGLWSNDTTGKLYRWAGERANKSLADDADNPLYEFQADGEGGGSWSESSPSNENYFESLWHGIDGASASCGGMGFYLGGWANNFAEANFKFRSDVKSVRLPGILTYDMGTRTWSNDSTSDLNTNGFIAKSSGVCVMGFGENPLFFTLGGNTGKVGAGDERQIDFRAISFYDPIKKTWYSQSVSGDIPDTRVGSCAAGVQGQNGTYEMYIYGGWNEQSGVANLGDMWVLSLPAFHWFRIDASAPTRQYHTCTVVGNRQMLVFGGIGEQKGWSQDDQWNQTIGIFDLTELKWSDGYDAEADAYQSPQVVQSWYETEGVDSVAWANKDIKALFVDGSTTTTSSDNTASTSSSETSTKSQTASPGAIAGGVIGGVAGICLIGAAFYLYRRRSHRKVPQHERIEDFGTEPKELDPHKILSPAPSELVDHNASHTPPPWELESREQAVELDALPQNGQSVTRR